MNKNVVSKTESHNDDATEILMKNPVTSHPNELLTMASYKSVITTHTVPSINTFLSTVSHFLPLPADIPPGKSQFSNQDPLHRTELSRSNPSLSNPNIINSVNTSTSTSNAEEDLPKEEIDQLKALI